MPPRRVKKTAVAKRRVCTPSASSSQAAAVEEPTAPEADSIMTAGSAIESLNNAKEGESQPGLVIPTRSAKKRAVAKVTASVAMLKEEAVVLVARDQIEQKPESLSEKEAETEKLEASKVERDSIEEEPIEEEPMEEELELNKGEEKEKVREGENGVVEGERSEEKTGEEKEIAEEPTKKEVKDEGEKIGKIEAEVVAVGGEIEEEPIEEEPIEEEPIEEEPVEEDELIEEEPVEEEEVIEEELVDEEEPMEEEPIEEEEEEEVEEEEEEEEPIEEDVEVGDGKEEPAKGRNNEEKRDIIAVQGNVWIIFVFIIVIPLFQRKYSNLECFLNNSF